MEDTKEHPTPAPRLAFCLGGEEEDEEDVLFKGDEEEKLGRSKGLDTPPPPLPL